MDFRILADIRTHNLGDFTGRTLPVLHTSKVDIHRDDIGTVGTHTCHGIVGVGLTECVGAHCHLWDIALEILIEAGCKSTCNLLRCTGIEFK